MRALAPDVDDALFVVGESGTTYEINLSVSDNPDQTVVISSITKSLLAQAEQAKQVPALDLMRSMMRGLPVDGYEIIKANRKEVYRDASFSMKLSMCTVLLCCMATSSKSKTSPSFRCC